MFGLGKVEDEMALNRQRTVRFYDERAKPTIPIHQKQPGFAASKFGVASSGKNKIFVAGDELWYNKIFDPSSGFILTWNHIFLFSCFIALFIDPMYFILIFVVGGQGLFLRYKYTRNMRREVGGNREPADRRPGRSGDSGHGRAGSRGQARRPALLPQDIQRSW